MVHPNESTLRTSSVYSDRRRRQLAPWLFLGPGLFVLAILNIFPMLYSLWVSLHHMDIDAPELTRFVGLAEYWNDVRSPQFTHAFIITVTMMMATLIVQFVGGFLIALALNRSDIRGHKIFASILILPLAISPLVVGILWRFMLNADFGVVIFLFHTVGLHIIDPIGTPVGAVISVIIVYSWEWTPLVALFLYSAMLGVDRSPFEAAMVDGASPSQTVFRIMLPMLRQIITILVLLQAVTAFRMFTIVDVLTAGGPGITTQSLSYLVWEHGLNYFTMGTATSMSWIMVVIMSVAAALFIKFMKFEV